MRVLQHLPLRGNGKGAWFSWPHDLQLEVPSRAASRGACGWLLGLVAGEAPLADAGADNERVLGIALLCKHEIDKAIAGRRSRTGQTGAASWRGTSDRKARPMALKSAELRT